MVASENDPYGALEYVQHSARQLGCEYVNVGALGTSTASRSWVTGSRDSAFYKILLGR
ncbi:hypothetical protein QNM99_07535 [Pseudomonas sp. PCH446]